MPFQSLFSIFALWLIGISLADEGDPDDLQPVTDDEAQDYLLKYGYVSASKLTSKKTERIQNIGGYGFILGYHNKYS